MWDKDSSYASDLDEELENWKNRLYEVSMLCCNMMTKLLKCVSTQVRNLPHFDGLGDMELFLDEFDLKVPEENRFQALELVLHDMPSHWWGTHKEKFVGWREYRRMMKLRFGYVNTRMTKKYNKKDDPCDHLAQWTRAWGTEPQPE